MTEKTLSTKQIEEGLAYYSARNKDDSLPYDDDIAVYPKDHKGGDIYYPHDNKTHYTTAEFVDALKQADITPEEKITYLHRLQTIIEDKVAKTPLHPDIDSPEFVADYIKDSEKRATLINARDKADEECRPYASVLMNTERARKGAERLAQEDPRVDLVLLQNMISRCSKEGNLDAWDNFAKTNSLFYKDGGKGASEFYELQSRVIDLVNPYRVDASSSVESKDKDAKYKKWLAFSICDKETFLEEYSEKSKKLNCADRDLQNFVMSMEKKYAKVPDSFVSYVQVKALSRALDSQPYQWREEKRWLRENMNGGTFDGDCKCGEKAKRYFSNRFAEESLRPYWNLSLEEASNIVGMGVKRTYEVFSRGRTPYPGIGGQLKTLKKIKEIDKHPNEWVKANNYSNYIGGIEGR